MTAPRCLRTAFQFFVILFNMRFKDSTNGCSNFLIHCYLPIMQKKIDSRVLCNAINKVSDTNLIDIICGFCDTLPLCKEALPGHDSYSQENLVKSILHAEYNAHDALQDCKMLQTLVETCVIC